MRNFFAAIARIIAYAAQYAAHCAENATRVAAGLCALPFRFVDSLIGGGGGSGPSLPEPSEEQQNAASEQISRAIEGLRDLEQNAKRDPSTLAWMYAAARPQNRKEMDLSPLAPHVREWLSNLDKNELKLMKRAGLRRTLDHINGQHEIDELTLCPQPQIEASVEGKKKPKQAHQVAYLNALGTKLAARGLSTEPEMPQMRIS